MAKLFRILNFDNIFQPDNLLEIFAFLHYAKLKSVFYDKGHVVKFFFMQAVCNTLAIAP